MSFLQVYRQIGTVSIGIVTTTAAGEPVSPDADPLAEFFRVDPATGLLAKDLNINGLTGEQTLSLVPGSGFLYAGPLVLSEAQFEQYEITVTYSHGAGAATVVKHLRLMINNVDQILFESRNVTVASVGTTFKAPTPTVP